MCRWQVQKSLKFAKLSSRQAKGFLPYASCWYELGYAKHIFTMYTYRILSKLVRLGKMLEYKWANLRRPRINARILMNYTMLDILIISFHTVWMPPHPYWMIYGNTWILNFIYIYLRKNPSSVILNQQIKFC